MPVNTWTIEGVFQNETNKYESINFSVLIGSINYW